MAEYVPFSSLSSCKGWDDDAQPPSTLSPKTLLSFNPNSIYRPRTLLSRLRLRSSPDVVVVRSDAHIHERSVNEIPIRLLDSLDTTHLHPYGGADFDYLHLGRLDVTAKVQSPTNPGKMFLVCLLDTRFLQFEQALVAACEASLDGGEVTFCLSPNYSMRARDPYLNSALRLCTMVKGVEKHERPVQVSVLWKLCLKASKAVVPSGGGVKKRGTFHGFYVQKGVEGVQRVKPDRVLIPKSWITNYDEVKKKDAVKP